MSRWWVHAGLIATALTSLVLEPSLALHIAFGCAFIALVVGHLLQRRRVSRSLARRLVHPRELRCPAGRLAIADSVLLVVTLVMLGSGVWDWSAGHPTKIRWHAIFGVVLAAYLVVHSVRRRSRLRTSTIR